MDTHELHAKLKEFITSECDLQSVDTHNCKFISESVFLRTKNYISETTIKKCFGLINGDFEPSPFVLNSLAQFVGYESWLDFSEGVINSSRLSR